MTSSAPVQVELPAIETFENRYPGRRYNILIECPEFTSMCPKTGLPDFGTISVNYIPDAQCIELKAFKYYILGYRNIGMFYENIANKILDDIIAAVDPLWIEVTADFTPRGGINTIVTVTHDKVMQS